MSKKSRRRNKILGALALGIGASKLGMLGGKSTASNVVGKTPEFRKSFVKPKKVEYITKKTKSIPGIKVDKDVISSGPFRMFGATNKGANFSAESIEKFKAANRAQEKRRGFSTLKDKIAKASADREAKKIAFNQKIADNNAKIKVRNLFKKGTMVKARGGGMARTKPTKLS